MAISPITVPLAETISVGKETFTEITFTRTTRGKDLVAMDAVQGDVRKSFALFASMAGVPIQVFLEMSTDDYEAVASAVAPLMGKRATSHLAAKEKAEDGGAT